MLVVVVLSMETLQLGGKNAKINKQINKNEEKSMHEANKRSPAGGYICRSSCRCL